MWIFLQTFKTPSGHVNNPCQWAPRSDKLCRWPPWLSSDTASRQPSDRSPATPASRGTRLSTKSRELIIESSSPTPPVNFCGTTDTYLYTAIEIITTLPLSWPRPRDASRERWGPGSLKNRTPSKPDFEDSRRYSWEEWEQAMYFEVPLVCCSQKNR